MENAFDGNDNLLNFETQTTTITTKSSVMDVDDLMNENNLLMDHQHQQVDNEFGPETDVDAVDEAMLMSSPIEQDDQLLAKEFQQFEQKEVDFTESVATPDTEEPVDQFIEPEHNAAAHHEYEAFLHHTSGHFGQEQPSANLFGLPKEVLGGGGEDGEHGE